MNKTTYIVIGCILILIGVISLPSTIHLLFPAKLYCPDGLCTLFFGTICALTLGVLYLLLGLHKLERTKLSDTSILLTFISLAVSIIGIPLLFLIVKLNNIDTFALLASILILYISCTLIFVSALICIISLLRRK